MNFLIENIVSILLLGGSIIFIFLGFWFKKDWIKHFSYSIAAIFIAFFCYNIICLLGKKVKLTKPENYYKESDLLGYVVNKDSIIANFKKTFKTDSVIYDVNYTMLNGRRNTPNSNFQSNEYALFFGGSFSFGEGLSDQETLPYFFNEFAAMKFNVRNYALAGYGPHQALALLEHILLQDIPLIQSPNVHAFYYFIPHHIHRAAGYAFWDQYGPKYEVKEETLIRNGNFSDDQFRLFQNTVGRKILEKWESSPICLNLIRKEQKVVEKDVLRVNLIFEKAHALLTSKGIKFTIILWDVGLKTEEKKQVDTIKKFLTVKKIAYVNLSDVLTDFDTNWTQYLRPSDGHPPKLTNQKIAKYLNAQILTY